MCIYIYLQCTKAKFVPPLANTGSGWGGGGGGGYGGQGERIKRIKKWARVLCRPWCSIKGRVLSPNAMSHVAADPRITTCDPELHLHMLAPTWEQVGETVQTQPLAGKNAARYAFICNVDNHSSPDHSLRGPCAKPRCTICIHL